MATAPQIKLLVAAAAATVNTAHPFIALDQVALTSPGAAVVMGINRQSENSDFYARFSGDGSTTVFNTTDDARLENLNTAAPIVANYLDVVVLINGIALPRVNIAPAAGEARVHLVATVPTLTLGTAYGAGTKIEVYMAATPSEVVTGGAAAVAGQTEEVVSFDFLRATTANAVIENIGH